MSKTTRNLRSALLAGASTALIASFGSTAALADPSVSETASQSIAVEQQFNDFSLPTPDQELNGNSEGTIKATINSNDDADHALQNSTVSVGTSATNGNSSSANGYANTADLTVNADLNNVTGSGLSTQNAQSNGTTDGASVTALADIGIALSQQNIATAATVSDSTDLGIALDTGAADSKATIAGNKHGATGVLNAGTNAINADVNNSSGSLGIASAQSSVNSTLAATQSSLDSFVTGSVDTGMALDSSTVELIGNSQSATAVANSVANSQSVTGNDLALAGVLAGQAQAGDAASDATASGGYATAAKQQLDAGSVSAAVDSATGGFLAQVTGDVSGSTLNNESNSAKALARGNEAVNATTFDANSVSTTGAGTVAAIASQQDVTGAAAINAGVTAVGVNGPMAGNLISGDVAESSEVTASNNSVLADAAGNRGGNSIVASGTTINTATPLPGSASNTGAQASAIAAFAVANKQSVSGAATITAGLVDDVTAPTSGTSVATVVNGSVADSSVLSNGNQLTAAAAGNTTLTGGNAITLTGTNVDTNAAVANVQTMDGSVAAAIGSRSVGSLVNFSFAGTSAPAGATFTFTGATTTGGYTQEDVDALNAAYGIAATFTLSGSDIQVTAPGQLTPVTSFGASYTAAPSANSPASGGVTVIVGNDISNSSVSVNGNTTSGSVLGNSASNSIVANATNLDNGSTVTAAAAGTTATGIAATADLAVANTQSVGDTAVLSSDVGAQFVIAAAGTTALGDLSNVTNSTVSVSGNTEKSAVTGNSAGNSVQLSATNLSNTSALANSQQMDGALTATVADFSGAFATIGRDVTASSVLVDGNTITGSTTGNDATNSVAVDGSSTLAAGDTTADASADPSNGTAPTVALAQADHALANIQGLGDGASLATNVTAGYGIKTLGAGASATPGSDDDVSDVTNSTLSVSNNVQSAKTTGNIASNSVDISGGSIATDGALLSSQSVVDSTLAANSTMTVGAPAANSASTLVLNGNANSASATMNTATNAMAVAAATDLASTVADAVLSGDVSDDYAAVGTYVVNNVQNVTDGSVGATAESTISNNDGTFLLAPIATDGIQSSTVTLNGNSTLASATSNSSVNTLALTANSSTASGGVLNQQTNGAGVTADAAATVGVAVAGFDDDVTDPSPVNNSAATISGNATVARAGGNSSSNSLSAAATTFANTSVGGSTSLNADRDDSVTASFAVLNEQANSGPINATATVTYGAAFNTLGSAPTVTNSSLALSGNSAASVAYGNATTNELTFAALNSPVAPGIVPTTTAIASNQFNSGNVTATTVATNVSFGVNSPSIVGSTGSVSQSSLSITGNALSAAAYGNSATNTLTISGNNVNVGVPLP